MTSKESCEKAKPAHEALMKCYPLMLDDLPDEIWLPIFNYEELYHASNYGRLKSFAKGKPRILKPVICNRYLYIGLHRKRAARSPRL